MHKPVAEKRTEPTIAIEPKGHEMSVQVHELATSCATMRVFMEFEGMKKDPAHTPSTEGEQLL